MSVEQLTEPIPYTPITAPVTPDKLPIRTPITGEAAGSMTALAEAPNRKGEGNTDRPLSPAGLALQSTVLWMKPAELGRVMDGAIISPKILAMRNAAFRKDPTIAGWLRGHMQATEAVDPTPLPRFNGFIEKDDPDFYSFPVNNTKPSREGSTLYVGGLGPVRDTRPQSPTPPTSPGGPTRPRNAMQSSVQTHRRPPGRFAGLKTRVIDAIRPRARHQGRHRSRSL